MQLAGFSACLADFVFEAFCWDDLAGEEKWEKMKEECGDKFWRDLIQDDKWLE